MQCLINNYSFYLFVSGKSTAEFCRASLSLQNSLHRSFIKYNHFEIAVRLFLIFKAILQYFIFCLCNRHFSMKFQKFVIEIISRKGSKSSDMKEDFLEHIRLFG